MTITRKFPRAKPHKLRPDAIRAIVRFRDGYRCQECGMTSQEHFKRFRRDLEVHRLNPGARYSIKGCITLCRPCHGPKPKSPKGTQLRNGKASLHVYIDPKLHAVVMQLIKEQRMSLTAFVEKVLEEYLTSRGYWPPKPKTAALPPPPPAT